MILYVSHKYISFEAGNLCRLFFPYEQHTVLESDDFSATARLVVGEEVCFTAEINSTSYIHREFATSDNRQELEYLAMKAIYLVFVKATGYSPSWGMLTGIHPVKLFLKNVKEHGEKNAIDIFKNKFFVSDEKIDLCRCIGAQQHKILTTKDEKDFSLYISIPFCPSRCSYCSFVSHSVEKSQKLIAPYVELLIKELKYTAMVVKEAGLRLISIYIGGGTPTTLTAKQLFKLITSVKGFFDLSQCTEFTVEAGRPDTIDEEKLRVLKSLKVDRISINPQTLEDKVLEVIGRRHSANDVLSSYALAKDIGFTINMDLIAGLQGDTPETFKATIDKVISLNPENITVHCLALKRSAEIFRMQDIESYHSDKEKIEQMISYAFSTLIKKGYKPYYLYRQSKMAGNLENIGWAKEGKICAYNVYTMDESQTVVACGAGGVSKIVDPYSDRLERIFNFKYSYEYTARFEEILNRKNEVTKLYAQFRQRIH